MSLPDVLTEPAAEPDASLGVESAMWAIVFAGGIGSRFWPLSSPERPKQLLSLVGERPLIADTVARFAPLVPPERVLVLTSRDIAPAIARAIPDVPEANVLVEPRPLGTGAALARGAAEVARRAGGGAVICAAHADLAVGFPDLFRATLRRAAAVAAEEHAPVSVAVHATRPESSFGYVQPVAPVGYGGTARVQRFVEKPTIPVAEELIAAGALWHSGIVVGEAQTFLDGLREHASELAPGQHALDQGDVDGFAEAVAAVSIERGLLERAPRLFVVPGEFGWDDVGTWASLRRARDLDDSGNGAVGPAYFVDATSNVVHADHGAVVLYGVSNMLVVKLDNLAFVTSLDRATDLRPLLDALPGSVRMNRGA